MSQTGELSPVSAAERIETIDVLRGFALCGILVVNIRFFVLPSCAFFDPRITGGFEGIHLLTWKFISIFFVQKMMGIFSMLFGAGLILMDSRAQAAGKPLRGVYYRRVLWLLLFGMIPQSPDGPSWKRSSRV